MIPVNVRGAKTMKLTQEKFTEAELLKGVIEHLSWLVQTGKLAFFERRNSGRRMEGGRYAGAYYRAFFKNGERYECGMPDIDGVTADGRYFAIELKRPTGKLSTQQIAIGEKLISLKLNYTVAYCIDDVIKFMRSLY